LSPFHRMRGDALALGDPAGAEKAYRQAIGIARQQGACAFELLAALPLARLLRASDRGEEARDALASAVEAFAACSEFPAIAEGRALLCELAGGART
jgi:predicted negative regulator of RcsB-dependent stress response